MYFSKNLYWPWQPTWKTREYTAVLSEVCPCYQKRAGTPLPLKKKTEVVVSTDAIGMGLNLPIRRIVFIETRKFDGVGRRSLLPEEIKQIAGRAGRFGLYDEGFVAVLDDLELIKDRTKEAADPYYESLHWLPGTAVKAAG